MVYAPKCYMDVYMQELVIRCEGTPLDCCRQRPKMHIYPECCMDSCVQEVVIEVVEARRLIAADRGGTSDPFVVITLGEKEHKTKVCTVLSCNHFGASAKRRVPQILLGYEQVKKAALIHIYTYIHAYMHI